MTILQRFSCAAWLAMYGGRPCLVALHAEKGCPNLCGTNAVFLCLGGWGFCGGRWPAVKMQVQHISVNADKDKKEELRRLAVKAVFALHHVPGSGERVHVAALPEGRGCGCCVQRCPRCSRWLSTEKSSQLQKLLQNVKGDPVLQERWERLQTAGVNRAGSEGMDLRADQ